MRPCRLLDIKHLDYCEALTLMRGLAEAKRRSPGPEVLMLLEHEPVITMGRRAGTGEITASLQRLRGQGPAVYHIERGGLATWHGPGQLVAYPVFNLKTLRLGVASFVEGLERIIISTLSDFGITACQRDRYPGVWAGADKIASIGLAVRGGITFHGLALNYDPDLSCFDLITPCGLTGVRMTSMAEVLGRSACLRAARRQVDPDVLRTRLAAHFAGFFDLDLIPWTLAQAKASLVYHASSSTKTAVA